MKKTQNHIDPYKIISTCAWCDRKIPKGSEIFSIGAKVTSGFDLRDQGGRVIQIFLAKSGKVVNAIAPTDSSRAKKKATIFCLQFVANNVVARSSRLFRKN